MGTNATHRGRGGKQALPQRPTCRKRFPGGARAPDPAPQLDPLLKAPPCPPCYEAVGPVGC
eukprot:13306811-Alexandrium_andersonii.AAC.1